MNTRPFIRSGPISLAALALALLAPPATTQTPRPLFDAPVVVADQLSRFEGLADLDGDDDLDIVGWYYSTPNKDEIAIRGWLNDGGGDFTQAWELLQPLAQSGEIEHAFSVADVDGNGFDDFAVSLRSELWVFTSNGRSAPSPWTSLTHTSAILDMELADFDDDGLGDIALLGADDTLRLLLNAGQGQAPVESWSRVLVSHSGDMRLIEANGDGLPDLMTARANKLDLHVIENGVRTQQLIFDHNLGLIDMHHSPQGDIDGDGDQDIVIFSDLVYRALRRTGPAAWAFDDIAVGGPATHLVDLDGDGAADGACCSSGGGGPTSGHGNKLASIFEISMNDGTGSFASAFELQGHGAQHLAGAADIDADGDVDLVAGRAIYFAPGPITGDPQPDLPELDYGVFRMPTSDFDGDGDPDFHWGLDGVLENRGDGELTLADVLGDLPPTPVAGGTNAWGGPPLVGDWDGDGDDDVLLAWHWGPPVGSNTFVSMRLLSNNGGGLFVDLGDAAAPGVDLRGPSYCSYKLPGTVADLDEDGDLDYIPFSCALQMYLNDGSGFFSASPTPAPARPDHVVDLDGDGHLDLVFFSTWARVAYGLGDGTFESPVNLPVNPAGPTTYDIGDLNDDGLIDVVGITPFDDLLFGWNQGNRVFTEDFGQLPDHAPDPGGTPLVRVADVDGDGLDDLMYGWTWGANQATSIFLQRPAGAGFEDPVVQMLRPYEFVDVDDDGDLDGVGASIIRNLAFDGPGAGARVQYGPGMLDAAGQVFCAPTLGASGPFREGETVVVRMTGMPIGAVGLMTVGLADGVLPNLPWGNTHILNWPWALQFLVPVLGGDAGVPNGGKVALPFTVDAVTATAPPLYLQCFFNDTSVPSGFTATDGLMLDFD